jgi:DNA repair photolyase
MRWSNLSLTAEQQHRLPGYRDEAVVRRFDAPEALDIRFYEVRARSALNRVPGASRMPFRWTVNPYRGCTHACTYCLWGGTRILLANGRTMPLAQLQIGAEILGTTGEQAPRRLVPTCVLAKWSTLKPAYRIVLASGAELLASGDHRFLTTEGWRYVSAGEVGVAPRTPLAPGDRLVGLGEDGSGGAPGARFAAGKRDRAPGPEDPGTPPGTPADSGECPSPTGAPGSPLQAGEGLRVSAVERLGMALRMYDITTGTGDFIAGGVVSHNCFARPTHRYLDFGPGRDFEREIVVKVNVPELLRAELARPSWRGEHVALGTNTDPYQWVEGRYKLMEGVWEALRDAHDGAGNPGSVLTKSPLLLRDLPLMRELAARTDFSACLSIPTLDERAWRASEPHTPNPRARLEAVAELNRAGIPTGVLIAPLMPGINDDPRQLEPLVQGALDAGATSVGTAALHLRRDVKEVFMAWLGEQRPELVERYEDLYARGAYAPREERARLADCVRAARQGRPAGRGRFVLRGRFGGQRTEAGAGAGAAGTGGGGAAPRTTAAGKEAARQERLF